MNEIQFPPRLEETAPEGERWVQSAESVMRRYMHAQTWRDFAGQLRNRPTATQSRFKFLEGSIRSRSSQKQAHPTDVASRLIAEAEYPPNEPPHEVEAGSHFTLDTHLKEFLASLLDIRIPAVKIYTNQAANILTHQYNADALAYRDNILFREGKFNPRDRAGIALLGHELTHAAQVKMENPSRSDTDGQERQALLNEGKVLKHFSLSEPPVRRAELGQIFNPQPSLPAPPSSGRATIPTVSEKSTSYGPSSNRTEQPKTALSSRTVSIPAETDRSSNAAAMLSAQQLSQIKEAVYRDLMDRIRIDFERGG